MHILFIDIDTLRYDHLGCYGYHRNTSPNLDRIASESVRFDNNYVSDAPCLPSRTALWSGRCGFRTGVVGHMGSSADPFNDGTTRGFRDSFDATSWMRALQQAGLYTVTVSPFGERHAAYEWYAGYREMYNPGKGGGERADEVIPTALDWLDRNQELDNWFLHVNVWDPHTPYRTPMEYGNLFEDQPLPAWMTEEMRQKAWDSFGPHSAQEPMGYEPRPAWVEGKFPRIPYQLDSMANVKKWIDGYDMGIWYADLWVGKILDKLEALDLLDDTVIVVSSDHGESQGEFDIWGDHQTADESVSKVPLLIRWPGITDQKENARRVDKGLHYHFDWAATLIELVGGQVPSNWDGQSFAEAFRRGEEMGREYLVISQGAWSAQRSVRFDDDGDSWICLRTYHDGHKNLNPVMLFNLTYDPHEQHDLSAVRPELVDKAMGMLAEWQHEMMLRSRSNVDPLMTVLREGGPSHTRYELPKYMKRLNETGRAHHAARLARLHPDEL
ncbi:MAG: sulfatase [Anaerolineae bacterium]|nr:sulfatase [Anaerolineae bacterium]